MMCPNHVNPRQRLSQVLVHVENGWLNGQRVTLDVHTHVRPKLHTGWLMVRLIFRYGNLNLTPISKNTTSKT
jgi:hypothetical protein